MSPSTTKLIIVDDDPLFLQAMSRYVRDVPDMTIAGSALSVAQALELLRELRVDLIVSDLHMPDADGYSLMHRVVRAGGPKIVAITAFDTDAAMIDALQAGADGYIAKSDSPAQILATLRRAANSEGTHLSPAHVARLVEAISGRPTLSDTPLTPKEREVYDLVCQGFSNAEIAEALHYSDITVRFGVASRARLIAQTRRPR